MRDPDYRVTFVERCDTFVPRLGGTFSGEDVDVEIQDDDGDLIIGTYEYESTPRFGEPLSREGCILFDTRTDLVAFTKQYDNPKEGTLVRALSEAFPVAIQAPSVPPASQHMLYREQGTGVNSVSFKTEQADYELGTTSINKTVNPENRAQEDLIFEQNTRPYEDDPIPGVEHIQEIVDECIEKGMYIWHADIKLTDDQRVGFSDPLRFSQVDPDFAHDGGFDVLFGYARVLVEQ